MIDPVEAYARDVAAGKVPAGKYHRLACERHLKDLARQGTPSFPFRFVWAEADRFLRFAGLMKHYKGSQFAGKPFVPTPVQMFRLGSIFGWRKTDGRRRFTVAYNDLPRKHGKSFEAAIVMTYVTFFEGEAGAEGYCLHPATRVLMADLSWRALRDVEVGDAIIGVDEEPPSFGKFRKLRAATVLGKVSHLRPALEISFTDGTRVVCSPDHRWLTRSRNEGNGRWRAARKLQPGYHVVSIGGQPWEQDQSNDAGYLAGVFDGEGYLVTGARCAHQIGFAQKPGVVLDKTIRLLQEAGFDPSAPAWHRGNTQRFTIRTLHGCLRFLGQVRPLRLLANAPRMWDGKRIPPGKKTIAAIRTLPDQILIDIETNTRTFVAEGLVSHNCIATKEKQARIVFSDMKQLIKTSGLSKRLAVNAWNINSPASASKAEPLGSDSDTTDGLNPHMVAVDELHAMKDRGLVDVMESATGARVNPLFFFITTHGDEMVSVWGDYLTYAQQILDGTLDDDPSTVSFFAFIAHADIGDDPFSETTWRKANPHWGVSVEPEDFRKQAAKAQRMPSAAAEFKQKRLNMLPEESSQWLDMIGYREGQTAGGLTLEQFAGRSCWLALDLSSSMDLTALVALFPPLEEGGKFSVLRWVWTPADTLADRAHKDRAPYEVWRDRGYLIAQPGRSISHAPIREQIKAIARVVKVEKVAYDPWQAHQLANDLVDADGFAPEQVVSIPQTYQGMSAAALKIESLVLEAKLDTGDCPLMRWCFANAVVQRDGKDNIQPIKKKSRGRIDPLVATVIATSAYLREPQPHVAEDPQLVTA